MDVFHDDDNYLIASRIYPDSYAPNVLQNVKMLSLVEGRAIPMGSYTFAFQKYPGDIDLIETFYGCCTIDEVNKKFARKFKSIVRNIVEKREHYMTEAKVGIDEIYKLGANYLGYLSNGNYIITEQNIGNLLRRSEKMFRKRLLNEEEIGMIRKLSEKILSGDKKTEYYDILYNLFRERYILRWSDIEILEEVKKLPGGRKITLKEALRHKSYVKVDMILKLNNKFTEMTNFFIIVLERPGRQKYAINFDQYFIGEFSRYYAGKILAAVPLDIEKLFYSKYYYNPFKGVKRIWALAKFIKDFSMLKKMEGIISSNISLMYQLKSEIENILVLIKKLKSPPYTGMNTAIQDIKTRAVYITELNDAQEYISGLFNKATEINLKNHKIEYLTKVKKFFAIHINYFTIQYLDSIGFTRVPNSYLPKDIQYNISQILPYDTEKVKGGDNPIEGGYIDYGGETFFDGGCDECGGDEDEYGGDVVEVIDDER